jgi:hypothetical protein
VGNDRDEKLDVRGVVTVAGVVRLGSVCEGSGRHKKQQARQGGDGDGSCPPHLCQPRLPHIHKDDLDRAPVPPHS